MLDKEFKKKLIDRLKTISRKKLKHLKHIYKISIEIGDNKMKSDIEKFFKEGGGYG